MSRFILTPRQDFESREYEHFLLIPTEGISEEPKCIELPYGLVPRLHSGKSDMLHELMMKISKANIGRSKDGLVTVGSRVMDINFDEFITDSYNGKFSECYEELYCVLRDNGITF